ncbi:hypothetical protein O181_030054 [Austropuccinia psidii MF-1]|uniref:Uncharacterized protein n=1 Tax=Austropuccinia psidii MF-1 TaxID=1389203 RepID=A0A9Q3CTC7_9BASI|nr:hypothetical protein [Austropuccinia psidii MF-1]
MDAMDEIDGCDGCDGIDVMDGCDGIDVMDGWKERGKGEKRPWSTLAAKKFQILRRNAAQQPGAELTATIFSHKTLSSL